MYCRKCGTNNEDGAKFCANCGSQMYVSKVSPENTQQKLLKKKEKKSESKPKNKKKLWIIVVAVVLLAAIGLAIFIAVQKKKEKEFDDKIERAENYLEELNYEKAEATYLAAIEINPKEEEPYIRLAEIYIVQNEPVKAVEILEQGMIETNSQTIEHKYELYTYVENVLIPEIGKAEPGIYETEYELREEYIGATKRITDLSGVIASRILDFDNDGEDELLVAVLKNDIKNENYPDEEYNAVFLEMYESVDGEIKKADEVLSANYVFGGGNDEESSGVFLKEHNDTIYICSGTYRAVNMFADGCSFMSYVVTYENEDFHIYAGRFEQYGGSSFEGIEPERDELTDKLDQIDLPKAAANIRDSYILKMTFEDEGIDQLFRIEGDNVGGNSSRYFKTKNESALGKYVIEFWIGNEEIEQKEKEESAKISKEELDSLRAELDVLKAETDAIMSDPNHISTMEMKIGAGEAYDMWVEETAYILEIVCSYMSAEEAENLRMDQAAWEAYRDQMAEEAAAPFEGGTLYGLEYVGVRYDETIARCYELLKLLE
ncbi:MAG: zinc-ribbon domain-containing protein [Schaedlerella sp.]|nr:zinc-ribbon domain-containing protein [Schaedlerella sp.]